MISYIFNFLHSLIDFAVENLEMSTSSNTVSSSREKKENLFKFSPCKMFKVEPTGNQARGIHCPTPRSGHRIIAAGGNIYSFGGYNPITIGDVVEHILFKELWVYNCVSNTWKHLKTSGNAPDELASHCAAYVNNHLLIFGGTAYPFGAKSSNDAHICNLKTLQWSKLETTGTPPPKQYGQAMALIKNKMYVVGGTTGYAYSNEVHCLDLITKEWKQLCISSGSTHLRPVYEPEPRYRHEIAIENDKIFVFGGGTAYDSFELSELPMFNLESNKWSKVKTAGACPAARRCHSCVQVGSDVYVCGGIDGLYSYNDIKKINLKTLIWEELHISLPYPLYFHAASLSHTNQLFIFGGVNGQENQRTNDMYTVWLKIPSLSTICWQAFLHYVPFISLLDKKKLFEAGVPLCYLNEVEFYSRPNSSVSSNNTSQVSQFEQSGDDWEMI